MMIRFLTKFLYMISIIIPVYNVEQFLTQCLDSILCQTYQDFEVILVDDGSPDNCPRICDEYARKDSRIHVIHQMNSGVSAARNKGIEHAKGEWISFIDSDDWVSNYYLENFGLDKSTADIIVQGLQYINQNTMEVHEYKELDNIILDKKTASSVVVNNDLLMQGYPVCKAFRKKFLDKYSLRFDITLSTHEDHIFVLQSFVASEVIELRSGTLYNYRYFHSSNTLSSKAHPWEETLDSSRKMFSAMKFAIIHFGISDKEYINYLYSRCVQPHVKALFDVKYDGIITFYKTISCILKDRKNIVKYYLPTTNKRKLIKLLIGYRLDFLLCIILVIYKKM